MSYSIKQVIVVRSDLKVRKGKFASQVAHASMKVFFDRGEIESWRQVEEGAKDDWPVRHSLAVPLTPEMKEWVEGSFAKIVLLCSGEEEMKGILQAAKDAGLPCSLVVDAGYTEFHGTPTPTCIAIGPAKSEDIDAITGPEGPFKDHIRLA